MPYIKKEFIESLTEQADIADVIGRFADLKRKGNHLFCLSPFSNEKTPSFCVDVSRQRFVDYSTHKSGDVIAFLMEQEKLTYPEAIEWLARTYGHTVEYENEAWAKDKAREVKLKDNVRPLLQSALKKYIEQLVEVSTGLFTHKAALEVFENRKYNHQDLVDWQIGYAPGKKFIFERVDKINRVEDAREVFLIGDKYDKYWDRLIYPIHDENGLLIGLAGRDLSGDKKAAKWINPTNNILYKKEKTWFALHRAKRSIAKKKEAWIVEGYNDVIAWHKFGLDNTVAPCGTAITERQIKILKRYCHRVNLCFDGDGAGIRSMLRYIPMFLTEGFDVQVLTLPDCDPDDFTRIHRASIDEYTLPGLMAEPEVLRSGFSLMIDDTIQGSAEQKTKGARELTRLVAKIEDESYQEIYLSWIASKSGLRRAKIDSWLKKDLEVSREMSISKVKYNLPQGVSRKLDDLMDDIERYGMFMSDERIWVMTGENNSFNFTAVSNFSIEIIQHMQDEKLPMKLVRIRNIHGDERIFDVPSDSLNTPQAFDTAMTNHGNFLFNGGRHEFQRLRQYLFDRMGVGYKIEVLGWQPEKFWVWNNAVTIPGSGTSSIDQNGVFKKGTDNYYIPSANRIYQNNSFKFMPQKKVVLVKPNVTFHQYATKVLEVHRSHGITALLFTLATMFLDIIEDKLGNFPLLFLYGQASSGKDQLIECCQSFFGSPQTPIHIGNKVSTSKAQIRKFAQFRNMIVHLSEYRPGDKQLDELLKGFWDRRGYERGTIDSAYGTETVPVHSSVIFTGNHYPDDDALITRFLCEEMTKSEFTLEEKQRYRELKDMNRDGISGFTEQMLSHREMWTERFSETYRKVEINLKTDLVVATSHDRMIGNAAVLGATYELMKDVVQFPFSIIEYINHIRVCLERQVRKLNTASVHMKWWDCFLASVRTRVDPLRHGKEFKIDDNKLYFNFSHTYNRVINQWWAQYHEQVPSKSKITDLIKKDASFVEEKKSVRMDGTRKGNNTSAWVIDMSTLTLAEDIIQAVEWQKMEGTDLPDQMAEQYPKNNVPTYNIGNNGEFDF